MVNEKLFDLKTGRLGDGITKVQILSLFTFILGVCFDALTPVFHGYMHETGHVLAAYLTGGSGFIANAHLAYTETHRPFRFIMFSSGVGFPFLVYYFLSSKHVTGKIPPLKTFFTACLFMELQNSYYSAGLDFEESFMAAVAFTIMWVLLLYLRIKGAYRARVLK